MRITGKKFHISLVVTSRNDNHGGNLTYRMQHFVDGFVAQCKKHDLHAELILVEWNPPETSLPLSKALNFPEDKGPCAIRVIRVPKESHLKLEHSDKIPLFQMIGKNIGIRRAQGAYVLATNIDILFSDEIVIFMRDRLKPGTLYRADRFDVPSDLPKVDSFEELLKFCENNFFRINVKYGTIVRNSESISKTTFFLLKQILGSIGRILPAFFLRRIFHSGNLNRLRMRILHNLHSNACGDFTLLSSQDWSELRGYPEWNMFSWHIDSVLLYQAKKNGIKEIDLPRKLPIYHIEHGRGYTPERAGELFKNLENKQIPYLSNHDFYEVVNSIDKSDEKMNFNNEKWGMADETFEEIWV